jgi:predicted CoA-binding protein
MPNADEILGERSYPDLASVPEPIDVVDVFRRSEVVPGIVEEAIKAGAKPNTVYLAEGTEGRGTRKGEKGSESSHHRTDGCPKSGVSGGPGG